MDDRAGRDMSRTDASAGDCSRTPLEHARALDRICATLPAGTPIYVATDAPALARAVADRHDRVLASRHLAARVRAPPGHELEAVADHAAVPDEVDAVVVGEPRSARGVGTLVDAIGAEARYEVLVGNPYSWNQFEDRTLTASTCAPEPVRRLFADRGFETSTVGYHGPRSIRWSAIGRLWQLLGRPDRRDSSSYRMRASLREDGRPLALLSCLVHITATRHHR